MDITPEIADRLELAAARLKAARDPEAPLEPPPGTPAVARLAPDPGVAPLAAAQADLRRARRRLEELETALAALWPDEPTGVPRAA